MRITIKVGEETTYWFDVKDRWSRGDLGRWRDALAADEIALRGASKDDPLAGEHHVLELLSQWCSALYVEDIEGKAYRSVAELSCEALDALDAPAARTLYNLAIIAFNQRAALGELKSGPS